MQIFQQFEQNPVLLFLLVIWSLIWKGIALWKSSRGGEKGWFVVILVVNTFGLLEIFYLYAFPHLKPHLQNLKNKFKKSDAVSSGSVNEEEK